MISNNIKWHTSWEKFAEVIGMLHPYQFAVDEINARQIIEVSNYIWTDEEI